MTEPTAQNADYVRLAIEAGQLVHIGDVYDDDPDSPTCGQFVDRYQDSRGKPDE